MVLCMTVEKRSIYNLPNGFQAYYLSNASGQSIPEGPINIEKTGNAVSPLLTGFLAWVATAKASKMRQINCDHT